MKKIFAFLFLTVVFFYACNSDKKPEREKTGRTMVDSLLKEIDDLHIQGMSKMASLTGLKKQTQDRLDSISKMAGKATGFLKARFDSLVVDLQNAEDRMNNWMNDFYTKQDTLSDNETERSKYLQVQKTIAIEVRDAILRGIRKADSLLKEKF